MSAPAINSVIVSLLLLTGTPDHEPQTLGTAIGHFAHRGGTFHGFDSSQTTNKELNRYVDSGRKNRPIDPANVGGPNITGDASAAYTGHRAVGHAPGRSKLTKQPRPNTPFDVTKPPLDSTK